jgi:PGF-CTERM protein
MTDKYVLTLALAFLLVLIAVMPVSAATTGKTIITVDKPPYEWITPSQTGIVTIGKFEQPAVSDNKVIFRITGMQRITKILVNYHDGGIVSIPVSPKGEITFWHIYGQKPDDYPITIRYDSDNDNFGVRETKDTVIHIRPNPDYKEPTAAPSEPTAAPVGANTMVVLTPPPKTPSQPGFGAVYALISLGVIGFIIGRRE